MGRQLIQYRLIGQAANQIIQHWTGLIIADKSGLQYSPCRDFIADKHSKPVKWTGEPLFELKPSAGRVLAGNPHVVDALQYIDFDQVCDGKKPIAVRQLYAQTFSLFRDYKDHIRDDWFHIPKHRYVETDEDAVYIHARRTDYCEYHPDFVDPSNQGAATTIDEFAECLKCFPDAKRIVVCTDDPRDEFLQEFRQFGLPWEIHGRQWDEDFLLMASCRNLLISQSTFSWLAGFLGRPEKIVCPCFPGSFWHKGLTDIRYPNLYVDDEGDRWEWVSQ